MKLEHLSFLSTTQQYRNSAEELLQAYRLGDADAFQFILECHPRFVDPKIPWLPGKLSDSELRSAALDVSDAQLSIARWYDFPSWPALVEYAEAVARRDSPVFEFESAVEAVITGDLATLESSLRNNPELVRDRSRRGHRATLLHYVAANGVEDYRQKSPKNSVAVAEMLLRAGAEVDAVADLYGGHSTTMGLLVSSCHPAEAGVQVALVETLLDFGAALEGHDSGQWVSPLMTALAFGYREPAEALARRGARVDNIGAAAGLGRLADALQLLKTSDRDSRHQALALAAQHGHVDVVHLLLDAGEDPNRYNPKGNHAHSTPLHQAVAGGHEAVVRLLVERGARLDIKDTIYQATPLGWATYLGRVEIEQYLKGSETSQ
jgi:Ankyrin repeats (3 copies)